MSALNSFMRGVAEAKFPDLNDRSNIWRILVSITAAKARDAVKAEFAQKRGGGKIRGESIFMKAGVDASFNGIAQALSSEDSPELAAELSENLNKLLDQLADSGLQKIALYKLEGYSNEEVATKTGRSLATVERRLKRIRKKWISRELPE